MVNKHLHDKFAASFKKKAAYLHTRMTLKREIRHFFDQRGYWEVDTPYLVPTPGEEVHLRVFSTLQRDAYGHEKKLYLHTSPEFAMKKILAETHKPLYQLARVWRNGEGSLTHQCEFTMLEWYRPHASLADLMDETELLLKSLFPQRLETHNTVLDFTVPFERLTMQQAFKQYVGVDLLACGSDEKKLASQAQTELRASENWEDLFFRLLLERIEPFIGRTRPVFLTHWPVAQAAMARKDPTDPRVALRFELYAGGLELANAFEELTDPLEQRQRFQHDRAQRRDLYAHHTGWEEWPMDEELLSALAYMPPASGIALGFDRLVMLASNATDIGLVQW